MKFYETGYLDETDYEYIKKHKLFSYGIRTGDDGWMETIEPKVIVNNCGYIVTNKEISFENDDDKYVDYNEFIIQNVNVSSMKDLIKNKDLER